MRTNPNPGRHTHRTDPFRALVLRALALGVLFAAYGAATAQSSPANEREAVAADVGRLLMLAYRGAEAPLAALEELSPSGFIFFAGNVPSTETARHVTQALQAASPHPLLFAIDQEGGPFTSYRSGDATVFPGLMSLGAAGDPVLAREVARATGLELAHAGFTMNFAPVVDVNSNPDNPIIGIRSFGSDPTAVATLGAAYAAGLHEAGIAAVAKHFPGHGDTDVDSHLALPSVAGDRARLDAVELLPFRALIEAGVPAIMTAHVAFPAFEDGVPATLSPAVLTGLLRDELGYDGLVVTDYMDMRAIADRYGAGEAAVRSVLAGADLVLLGHDTTMQRSVHAALADAVRSGRLSVERVHEAIRRIERVAERYPHRPNAERPDPQAHRALAFDAAARGVTLLADDAALLPLDEDDVVAVVAPTPSVFGEPPHLGAILKRHHPNVRSVIVDERPSAAQIDAAVRAAGEADLVVLGSYSWLGGFPTAMADLAAALHASGTPLVVVTLGNPDDLRHLPFTPGTYLAAYGYREANLEGAARVLTGRAEPRGRLPVDAGPHPRGSGLGTAR